MCANNKGHVHVAFRTVSSVRDAAVQLIYWWCSYYKLRWSCLFRKVWFLSSNEWLLGCCFIKIAIHPWHNHHHIEQLEYYAIYPVVIHIQTFLVFSLYICVSEIQIEIESKILNSTNCFLEICPRPLGTIPVQMDILPLWSCTEELNTYNLHILCIPSWARLLFSILGCCSIRCCSQYNYDLNLREAHSLQTVCPHAPFLKCVIESLVALWYIWLIAATTVPPVPSNNQMKTSRKLAMIPPV